MYVFFIYVLILIDIFFGVSISVKQQQHQHNVKICMDRKTSIRKKEYKQITRIVAAKLLVK